jgi:hypothetical protein
MKNNRPRDPFSSYEAPFKDSVGGNVDPFTASSTSGQKEQARRQEQSSALPIAVSLPPHLFIPETGQSVDIRRLASVAPATSDRLIAFTAPKGAITRFIGYSVFNDALNFNLVEFVPKVNGRRVFPFHGDPQLNFKIALGLGPDMSNANSINCLLDLNPGDFLTWDFFNNDVVAVAAGVRMIGYVDQTITRKIGRFGG